MTSVVIVDDSQTELAIFSEAIKNAGYDCIGVSDPRNALEVIRVKNPDFVLCDVTMPHISGIELCKQIKLNPMTRDIPVLFISSDESSDHIIAAMHLGSLDYIRKPIEIAELVKTIHRVDLAQSVKNALEPVKKEAQRLLDKYDRRSKREG